MNINRNSKINFYLKKCNKNNNYVMYCYILKVEIEENDAISESEDYDSSDSEYY